MGGDMSKGIFKTRRHSMKKTAALAFFGLFMLGFMLGCLTSGTVTTETTEYIDNDGGDISLELITNFEWLNYRVRKGDTIESISGQFGVSVDAIIVCNDLRNVRNLQVGNEMRIPNMDGAVYMVKAGDTITGIANTYHVPEEVIRDVNNISGGTLKIGETLFIPSANTNMNH
jgi:LysM repeat protein